jgi:predicted ribosome quality control (RQC) complex YloA/Tae2 family protein
MLNWKIKNIIITDSDSDIIRTLARSGWGGLYSEEICLRSGVDKKHSCPGCR